MQLGIADYANQFSSRHDDQLASFLAGKPEHGVHAGSPPTREDLQHFIGSTPYGQDPANARGIAGREAHFNAAMSELGLGPAIPAVSHNAGVAGHTLEEKSHGVAVRELQSKLAELGYTDSSGQPLHADGIFGRDTRNAVEAFQANQGLLVDGHVGRETSRAVDDAVKAQERSAAIVDTSLGCSYLDRLCSAANDPVAFDEVLQDLSNSPYGEAFRAEGIAACLELQNQQLQQQLTQQQPIPQALQHAPRARCFG